MRGATPTAGLLLLLALSFSGRSMAADQKTDATILLEWRSGFECAADVDAFLNSQWVGDTPCDSKWWGIGCSLVDGIPRVTSINLDTNSVGSERWPRLIVDLTKKLVQLPLVSLRTIGVEVQSDIPSAFKQLSRLRVLSIRLNNISIGFLAKLPLPSHLPQTLRVLILNGREEPSFNPFPDWSVLTNLKKLHISRWYYNASRPDAALLPAALESLVLSHMGFTGSFPASYSQLTKLTNLNLGFNKITGALPQASELPPALEVLDLTQNNFQGSIPDDWAALKLKKLSLRFNNFRGRLPNLGLKLPPTLRVLDMHGNWLTGELPASLAQLQDLRWLDLSSNHLSGVLPAASGMPPNIQELFLGYNEFSGVLPLGLSDLKSLSKLDLSGNQLSGPLPTLLPPSLNYLDMSYNQLSGPLPTLPPPNLNYLDLSNNQLSSPLPTLLPPNLNYLYMSYNQLSGSLPTLLPLHLTWLSMSYNKLSGPLPKLLPPKLRILGLSTNNLTGSLPPEYANLEKLEWASLQMNPGLVGRIPDAWGAESALPSVIRLQLKPGTGLCGPVPANLIGKVFDDIPWHSNQYFTDLGECPDGV